MWQPIDLTTPVAYRWSTGWRLGNWAFVVMAAASPTMWLVGLEVMTRTVNGFALYVGPVALIAGFSKPLPTPPADMKGE